MRIGVVVFSSGSGATWSPWLLRFKESRVKILSITIRGLLIIGLYAPDGKETEGTDVLLSILDRAVTTFHHQNPRTENQALHPSWTSYSFPGFIPTPSESLNKIA
jgi:hypothetical protein